MERPYDERLGFRALTPEEITPGIAAILADEAAHGIDPSTRVVMLRSLTRPAVLPRPRSCPARGTAPARPLS